MDAATEIKDIVSMVVCGLSDLPKGVQIRAADIDGRHVFITVICEKSDIKKIVGKEGRNIQALRHIVQAVAAKHQTKSTLAIDE